MKNILGYSKLLQTKLFIRIEKRFSIKVLVTKNFKSYGIYRRMCDVFSGANLSEKHIHKWAKHGFSTTILSQKERPTRENSLSCKERDPGEVWKNFLLAVFYDIKKNFPIDFLEKCSTVLPTVKTLGKINHVYWMIHVYIYIYIYIYIFLFSLNCSTLPSIRTFILLSVKQGCIKHHFKSLWYDATWD